MAINYAKLFNRRSTPQSQPIPGSTQVANSAGGYAWPVDDWTRLDRFLILGAEGGTYYIGERDLVKQNHDALVCCIKADGVRAVNRIVEISDSGRAPKNDPAIFALRRAAAMQAYYEHMPLRRSAFPRGSAMQLYRRAQYGDLLDLNLLDTRQFRTDQPCEDRFNSSCDGVNALEAQVLGQAQEAWLLNNLDRSQATWKVLAQQIMVMDLDRNPGDDYGVNPDSWAGYRVPRERLLRHIRDRRIANTVVLTGDEHQNYAGELFLDGRNPEGAPIATEFVTTSISSGGDGVNQRPDMARIQSANSQLKFNNAQRGYVICDVTPERWQTEFKVLDQIHNRDGVLTTRTTLAIEAGDARLVAA